MNFIKDVTNRFKEQSFPIVFVTVFAKFLFGVGFGILLTTHFQSADWNLVGWSVVFLSLILSIPAFYKIVIEGVGE